MRRLKADLDLSSVKKVVPMEEELKGFFKADVRMKGRMSDVDAGRYDNFKADGTMTLREHGLSERFAARGGHHRIGLLLQPALSGAHQVRGQFGHKQPASPRPHGQLPAMVA
jgi:hypothetical protein